MRELLPRLPLRPVLLTLCFLGVVLVQLSTAPGASTPLAGALRLLSALLLAALWTGAVVLAVALSRRCPIESGRVIRSLPVHLAMAACFGLAHHLIGTLDAIWRGVQHVSYRVSDFMTAVVAYLLLSGVAQAIGLQRRLREKELTGLRLQAALSEAELEHARYQLQAVKMELNPHFLFNSLHAISALMHQDAKLANRMLVRVSDLLRRALASVGTQEVSLEEELDFARLFLEVEQVRFADRLEVAWDVEEEARAVGVPHMILQPLVENAVKHGIAPRGAGRVTIRARHDGGKLRLEVQDDGAGLGAARGVEPGSGVGLENVRQRLRQLAPGDHSFDLGPAPGGGALAVVMVPWRELPADGASAPAPDPAPAARAPERRTRRRATVPTLLFFLAVWSGSLVAVSETLAVAGRSAAPWRVVLSAGLNAVLLTALVTLAVWCTRRFPVRGAEWRGHLADHLRASVAFAVVALASKTAGRLLIHFPMREALPSNIPGMAVGFLLLYAAVAGVAHAFAFAHGYREKEAAELRLRHELSRAEAERTWAELQILKIELNPHFLFSALHAISALIPQDLKLANRIVVRLSEVLRGGLGNRNAREIPLEEEMSGLEPLLEIESIRWGGRLHVESRIDDEALDARVPPLLLQSLVEHLLQHGVPRGDGQREISISARRAGSHLELELRDSTLASLNEPTAATAASGLNHVRMRLQQLYGDRHRMEVTQESAGVAIALHLPWHEELIPEESGLATPASGTTLRQPQPR